jgi:hypothetical protein
MLLSEDDKVWKDPGANNASNKCDVDPKRVMEVSAALLRKQWHHPASKQVQFTQVTASLLCDECTHCQVNAGSSIPIKYLVMTSTDTCTQHTTFGWNGHFLHHLVLL